MLLIGASRQLLHELTDGGRLVATRDLTPLGLRAPRSPVFAPSGDATDDPSTTHLYLLERRRPGGRLVELALAEPAAPTSAAPVVAATLVRTTDTSRWDPPSPDPAGLVYHPGWDQLVVRDSEVDEMAIFRGRNVYRATTAGTLQATCATTAFSDEPTGVSLNPADGHLFFSDDNRRRIFELDPGPDGTYCTADDTVTSFSTSAFGATDPEDVSFGAGKLFIADGVNAEVYVVSPGRNGRFDGVPPAGDDQVIHFDTSALGVRDAEGVGYCEASGTLFILSRAANDRLAETTPEGTVVRFIDLGAVGAIAPAGVACAPGSQDPSVVHLYLVDRGVDNGRDPNENDGRVYEVSVPLAVVATPTATPSPTPTGTPTASATPTSTLTPTPTARPTPAVGTLHVGDLDGVTAKLPRGRWSARVVVTIHDWTESPVAGATVCGTFRHGSSMLAAECTTDGSGSCSVEWGPSSAGEVRFSVQSVSLSPASLSYLQAANHDPDGDSDGTTIVLAKPA